MVFTQPVSAVATKAWPGHKRHPYKLAWYRRSRGGYRDLSSARFDPSFILAIYVYNEAIPGVVQRYSAGKRYRSTDSEKKLLKPSPTLFSCGPPILHSRSQKRGPVYCARFVLV